MLELCFRNVDGVWFGVACKEQHVVASTFGNDEKIVAQNLREILPAKVPLPFASAPSTFAQKMLSIMKDIYDGKEISPKVSLAVEGLPVYKQRVLRTVSQIPVGYLASYGGVAKAAGGGARAVGNAMATNPFAPIVPCHRVVTSSLGLGGYGGGLRVKYEFLQREKRGFTESREVLADGRVLRVFPVEFVLRKLEKSVARNSL
jgi:methylated-DNA-[protein]-cysteine S-methyltransferase